MVRASKKTGKKNRDIKKNLTLDQIKYLTGLNLWNYGGICKAMMIRQLKTKKGIMKTYEITISLRTYQKAYFKANSKKEALKKADDCVDWKEIGDSNQTYIENIKLITD